MKISYRQALNQALHQEMERDPNVIVMGVSAPYQQMFGSLDGLQERFGADRVMDTPVSEDAMTGFAIGAALNGLRPVHCHIRVDFLVLAMNQLANILSPLHYGSGGVLRAPLVIRAVVGRGWGQGWQHSKSLHSVFAHLPGIRVLLPTTPRDAKGLLAGAIRGDHPTIFLEHRWLYDVEDEVPEGEFVLPTEGAINLLRQGSDITVVATSWMAVEALKAAEILARKQGVQVEVVNPVSLNPFEAGLPEVFEESVDKTRHVVVADNDWAFCGLGAELACQIYEACFPSLDDAIERVGWPSRPCPTAREQENAFYPGARQIINAVQIELGLSCTDLEGEDFYSHERRFKGPF